MANISPAFASPLHTCPSEAVPHTAWLARWNVSIARVQRPPPPRRALTGTSPTATTTTAASMGNTAGAIVNVRRRASTGFPPDHKPVTARIDHDDGPSGGTDRFF